jgi:hypothetical protein
MGKFDEILRKSLKGINDAFESAKNDLEEVVHELQDAIRDVVSGKNVNVWLDDCLANSEEQIVAVRVGFKFSGREQVVIGYYRITLGGYPISYGTFLDDEERFEPAGNIENRAGLEQHFAEMLADKQSPLVLFLAYLRR